MIHLECSPPSLEPYKVTLKMSGFPTQKCYTYTEIFSHKLDAYTIDPLSRRLLETIKTEKKVVYGHMVGFGHDTKRQEEKGKGVPRA